MVYCMNQRKSVSTIDKKRSSEVISELEARFLEGEKLTPKRWKYCKLSFK